MPSSITKAGADLDSIFDPYVTGAKPAATGITIAGVDLIHRYAPLSFGAKAALTGITVAGAGDINNLFAAKGTASYNLNAPSGSYSAVHQALTSSGNVQAMLQVTLSADGSFKVTRQTGTAQAVTLVTGTWNTSADPASAFEVMFTSTHAGGTNAATISNGAVAYSSLGTGRGASATLGPYPAADTVQRTSDDVIRILIRRIATGQVVADSTVSFHTETFGFA